MGKLSEDDQENDEGWDPGVTLIHMNILVAQGAHQESCNSDDEYAGPARHVSIDCIEKLCADDGVYRAPSDTGEAVEQCNDLGTIVAEEESREDHLAQTEFGTECAHDADRQDAEEVEEEDSQESIDESQVEDWVGECTDGKGTDDHVGSKPLSGY